MYHWFKKQQQQQKSPPPPKKSYPRAEGRKWGKRKTWFTGTHAVSVAYNGYYRIIDEWKTEKIWLEATHQISL